MKTEYNAFVTLLINEKSTVVPIHIEDEELDIDAKVSVEIVYSGVKYRGIGKELDWTDAFADLQKKLPESVLLKCCISCKYGNLNLYGNIPNQVICSYSKNIHSKDELVSYLSTRNYEDNEHNSTYACEHFDFVNKEHYSYNDFLYYVEN